MMNTITAEGPMLLFPKLLCPPLLRLCVNIAEMEVIGVKYNFSQNSNQVEGQLLAPSP